MTRRTLLLLPVLPFLQLPIQAPKLIVTTDIIGTPRPQGPRYDIGAYEYIGKKQLSQPVGVKII